MSAQYEDELDATAKARYDAKLKSVGIEVCPYKLPSNSLIDDPTKWPNVEYGDIYNYLINSPGIYMPAAMKNYKSLEAHRFFLSGWVDKVLFCRVEANFLFRCRVKPSYRVTCSPHNPVVCVSSDGCVLCAHCDCMAGLGETCSHVAALLFKIEAAVRLGLNHLSCTDLPCKWNDYFVKNVQGKPLSQIDLFSDNVKLNLKCSVRKRKGLPREATDDEKMGFLQKLSKCDTPPICLSLFEDTNHVFHPNASQSVCSPQPLPQCLSTLYSPTPIVNLAGKIEEVFQSMKVSEIQQQQINEATQDQSKSIEWHSIRTGRITSSIVHQVLHTSPINPCKSVINSICHPKLFTTEATEWGKQHEKDGLDAFRKVFKKFHCDIQILKCGLFLLQDASYIGGSPDAIAICSCHGKSVVEVKCPFSYKKKSLDHYHINTGHKYYSQIQLQMMATGVETDYFVVWTPEKSFVQTIKKDPNYQSSMFLRCQSFWKDHILPELLTQKAHFEPSKLATNNAPVSEPSATAKSSSIIPISESSVTVNVIQSSPVKTYCYCKGAVSGDMIGCDNPSCPYEWIHKKCANIKKVPKGKWYCICCKK